MGQRAGGGAAIGAIIGGAIGSVVPVVGTAVGAGIGAAAFGGAGAVGDARQTSKAADTLKKSIAEQNKPKPIPNLPGVNDNDVQTARGMKLQQLRQRSGVESTNLTGNRMGG